MAKKAWSVRTLVAGWAGYWALFAAATLAKPIGLAAKLANQPPNSGDASFNIGNSGITASIHSYGHEVWSLHTTWFALALWIAGPPLLIWGAWVWRRSSVASASVVSNTTVASNVAGSAEAGALNSGDTIGDVMEASRAKVPERRP